MKVFIYSLGYAKPHRDQVKMLFSFASSDQIGTYKLINSAYEADMIICCDQGESHSYGEFYQPNKTFIYSTTDSGFSLIPGLFASVKSYNYSPVFARSTTYLNVTMKEDLDLIEYLSSKNPTRYLFSFVGSSETCKIRKSILNLNHDLCYLSDSNSLRHTLSHQNYWSSYLKSLAESSFILCPRGMGVSSIRLFETMRAGRVPVIIADDWVPPAGPAWDNFSIRVSESNIHLIPEILEKEKSVAIEMGKIARIEWNKYYSRSNIFHHLMAQYNEMLESNPPAFKSIIWYGQKLMDVRNIRTITYPYIKARVKFYIGRNSSL